LAYFLRKYRKIFCFPKLFSLVSKKMQNAKIEISPDFIIEPRPNQKEWWVGDGNDLPQITTNQEHCSLYIIENFLNKEQCQILIDAYENNYQRLGEKTGVQFWDGRYIQFHDIIESETRAASIMQQIRHIASMYIMNEFVCEAPIYPDTAQIVRWEAGMEMKPHADNMMPDGSPNYSSHRDFTSIIYLNDDFEGGHTFFPSQNARVAPKAGSLVLFGAGYEFVHGVTKVTAGKRYIYSGWFSYDKSWLDVSAVKII
jgi:predicted 2-oxoglutarate/Fe(II)-dependent dioxygenase YbiX